MWGTLCPHLSLLTSLWSGVLLKQVVCLTAGHSSITPCPSAPQEKSCQHPPPFLQWSQESWHGLQNLGLNPDPQFSYSRLQNTHYPSSLSHNCNVAMVVPERLLTQVQVWVYFVFRSKRSLTFCTLITLWRSCVL